MPRPFRQATPQRRSSAARHTRIATGIGATAVLALAVAIGYVASIGGPRPSIRLDGQRAPADVASASDEPTAPSPSAAPFGQAPAPTSALVQPTKTRPSTTAVPAGPFAGDLMIADRQNGRILIVDSAGAIRWRFPVAGSLPRGQGFAADDAFLAPDGRTIVANEEQNQVVVRIDIATRRVIWEYGRYGVAGARPGELRTPDDAYPLADGNVIVADIGNCRVIEINRAKRITRQWGRTGVCRDHAPRSYGSPNGDTPLPDGGLLITEIKGSRVVRLDRTGHVVFDIHVPTAYPSDAHLDAHGNILVVDYSSPGAIVRLDRHGRVLWRYAPRSGRGRLDHPSLAIDLGNGLVAVNDDFRHRVLVIDPRTNRIVWQYGHTDRHGRSAGYLFTPDGIDLIPPDVAATL
jgi:outer membrane protein assembly factor BamB